MAAGFGALGSGVLFAGLAIGELGARPETAERTSRAAITTTLATCAAAVIAFHAVGAPLADRRRERLRDEAVGDLVCTMTFGTPQPQQHELEATRYDFAKVNGEAPPSYFVVANPKRGCDGPSYYCSPLAYVVWRTPTPIALDPRFALAPPPGAVRAEWKVDHAYAPVRRTSYFPFGDPSY